jgi:hypothetical protein
MVRAPASIPKAPIIIDECRSSDGLMNNAVSINFWDDCWTKHFILLRQVITLFLTYHLFQRVLVVSGSTKVKIFGLKSIFTSVLPSYEMYPI